MLKTKENYKEILVKLLKKPGAKTSSGRNFISTGLKLLDASLGGGIIKGSVVTVMGGVGTGKTLFALSVFLKTAFKSRERGLIVSFDETAERLRNSAKEMKLSFSENVEIVHYPASLIDADKVFKDIAQQITKNKVTHLLLNSVSTPGNVDLMLSLLDLLIHYKVTAILVNREEGNNGRYYANSDAVLKLKSENQKLTVETIKARGGNFEPAIVPFKITAKGLQQVQAKQSAPAILEEKILNVFIDLKDINIAKEILNDFDSRKLGFKMRLLESTNNSEAKILESLLHGSRECDLTICNINEVGRLADKKAVLSIDSYFTEAEKLSYFPGLLANCYYGGKLYGFPNLIGVLCLMYRKDLLEKYGLKPPGTFAGMREAFDIIRKEDKTLKECVVLPNFKEQALYLLLTYYLQAGGDVSDLDSLSLNTLALEKAVFQLADETFSVASMSANSEETLKRFFAGEALFSHGWNTDFHSVMKEPVREKIGFMKFPPREVGGKSISLLFGEAYVIPANTKYPAHAAELLRFLSSFETEKKIQSMSNYPKLSGRQDVAAYFEKKEERAHLKGMGAILSSTFVFHRRLGFFELAETIKEAVLESKREGGLIAGGLKKIREEIKHRQRLDFYGRAVEDAKKYMEKRYFNKLKLEDIAGSVNLSKYYFEKIFKKHAGMSVFEYLTFYRIEKAKILLKEAYKKNITQIADELGFYSVHHFSRVFKKLTGKTPSEVRLSAKL